MDGAWSKIWTAFPVAWQELSSCGHWVKNEWDGYWLIHSKIWIIVMEERKQFCSWNCQQVCEQAHAAGHQELQLRMQLSATFLMREGADFHRSQGYGQKQGIGIFLSKLPGALGMPACRRGTQAKGMASEQGSPPRLLRCPFAACCPSWQRSWIGRRDLIWR